MSFCHIEWHATELLNYGQVRAGRNLSSLGSALQLGQRWEWEGASREVSKVLEGHDEEEKQEEGIGEVLHLPAM